MEVHTAEFGTVQVEEKNIFSFPDGLYGLEEYRTFALIHPDPSLPFAYLQAVDEPMISLLVADPFVFHAAYEFELSSSEVEALERPQAEDLEVWVTVTIREDALQEGHMNLLAPIVLNKHGNIGRQVVLHDSDYATRVPLFAQAKEAK